MLVGAGCTHAVVGVVVAQHLQRQLRFPARGLIDHPIHGPVDQVAARKRGELVAGEYRALRTPGFPQGLGNPATSATGAIDADEFGMLLQYAPRDVRRAKAFLPTAAMAALCVR